MRKLLIHYFAKILGVTVRIDGIAYGIQPILTESEAVD